MEHTAGSFDNQEILIMQELNEEQLKQIVGGAWGGFGSFPHVFLPAPATTSANVYANASASGGHNASTFTTASGASGPVGYGGSLSVGLGWGNALVY